MPPISQRTALAKLIGAGLACTIIQPTVASSLVDTEAERQAIIDKEITSQRMISYLGRASIDAYSTIDDLLGFGYSDSWTAARNVEQSLSVACADGGGADVSLTRTGFTTYAGSFALDQCQANGLTMSGTVSFTFDDTIYQQSFPADSMPLQLTLSNVKVTDVNNLVTEYSGTLGCNAYVTAANEAFIYNQTTGTRHTALGVNLSVLPNAIWDIENLFRLEDGSTGLYPIDETNCDITHVTATQAGENYSLDDFKYIGRPDSTEYLVRYITLQNLLNRKDLSTTQLNILTTETPTTEPNVFTYPIDTYVTLPDGSKLGLETGASVFFNGTPDIWPVAWGSDPDLDAVVQIWQTENLYTLQLDDLSGTITANNYDGFAPALIPPPNTTPSPMDLDNDGILDTLSGEWSATQLNVDADCNIVVLRSNNNGNPLTIYTEFKPDALGQCRVSNGFYVDSAGTVYYEDANGDGINDLFTLDDDGDGVPDAQDPLPLDPNEQYDADLDGIGDNADPDDDNDGYNDVLEQQLSTNPLDSADIPVFNLTIVPMQDMNGDSIDDIGQFGHRIIDEKPTLVIKSPTDSSDLLVYAWPDNWDNARVFPVADRNQDGIGEIAISGTVRSNGRTQVIIKDGADPLNTLGVYTWPNSWQVMAVNEFSDINGDGINELALAGINNDNGRPQFVIRDGVDATLAPQIISWPNLWSNVRVFSIPDLDGDGIDEVAMAGQRSKSGRHQLIIKNLATGEQLPAFNWGDNWYGAIIGLVPDFSGDGISDIALFGIRKDDNRAQMIIRDASDRSRVVGMYGWPAELLPTSIFFRTNTTTGVPDIAVGGIRLEDGRFQVIVKDGATRKTTQTFGWSDNWTDVSLHMVPDLDRDGVEDFVLLGNHRSTGTAQVAPTASSTGGNTRAYNWPNYNAQTATLLPVGDIDGDGVNDLALYDELGGNGTAEIKSGSDPLQRINTIVWPALQH